MTATQVLAAAAATGLRLRAKGDRIRYSPISRMTPELQSAIVEHKAEILKRIRNNPASESAPPGTRQPMTEVFASAVALDEVTSFAVKLLPGLPAPPILICELASGIAVELDFRRPEAREARSRLRFTLHETLELVLAIEQRWPFDFNRIVERKIANPGSRLRFKEVARDIPAQPLLAGAFLTRLGLQLRSIELRPQ